MSELGTEDGIVEDDNEEVLDDPCFRPVIVTGANEESVQQLRNLIGSVHKNEPTLSLVVYDLGLDKETIKELRGYCNISLFKFPFQEFPSFFDDLSLFARVPIVLRHALQHDAQCIVYLDPSKTINGSIEAIKEDLGRDGYWFTSSGENFPKRVEPGTKVVFPGLGEASFSGMDKLISASVMGWKNNTFAQAELLETLAEWSVTMRPEDYAKAEQRPDQIALNYFVYAPGAFKEQVLKRGEQFKVHQESTSMLSMRGSTLSKYSSFICKKGALPH